jgi:hypothetical protein
VELAGRVDPLELLEALQDRDARPYQLMLRMPNGTPPAFPEFGPLHFLEIFRQYFSFPTRPVIFLVQMM